MRTLSGAKRHAASTSSPCVASYFSRPNRAMLKFLRRLVVARESKAILDVATESIDLGSDQDGYACFYDRANTHFWSKIGNALLFSIVGARVQLSQPQAVHSQNYNSQQIAAAALGQQFGELGQEYARAGLSIPNTLEIHLATRLS